MLSGPIHSLAALPLKDHGLPNLANTQISNQLKELSFMEPSVFSGKVHQYFSGHRLNPIVSSPLLPYELLPGQELEARGKNRQVFYQDTQRMDHTPNYFKGIE